MARVRLTQRAARHVFRFPLISELGTDDAAGLGYRTLTPLPSRGCLAPAPRKAALLFAVIRDRDVNMRNSLSVSMVGDVETRVDWFGS